MTVAGRRSRSKRAVDTSQGARLRWGGSWEAAFPRSFRSRGWKARKRKALAHHDRPRVSKTLFDVTGLVRHPQLSEPPLGSLEASPRNPRAIHFCPEAGSSNAHEAAGRLGGSRVVVQGGAISGLRGGELGLRRANGIVEGVELRHLQGRQRLRVVGFRCGGLQWPRSGGLKWPHPVSGFLSFD